MLTKLATLRGISPSGDPLVQLFPQGGSIKKLAGQMLPEIQDWLSTYKSDKENIAVLVNALGASEYWAQNSNGDRFGWAALSHDCRKHIGLGVYHPIDPFTGKVLPPYGYWTFEQYAKPYVHHKNKDPNRAFGEVALSVLNHRMKRVELVVLINRQKAMQFGAQHVVDRIDAGEYPDVSMGTRVPYDVCVICGNKSKTRHDYCDCIKNLGMGTILPDGRQVGVDNPHPRFFDISFVFIGADKTAKMMCKLGSGLWVPQSVIDGEILYGIDRKDPDLVKSAARCSMKCGQCDMSSLCEKPDMLKQAYSTDPPAKRTYEVEGNPEAVKILDKVLRVAQTLGSWGASREVSFGWDGDGPHRVKVKGNPTELERETLKKQVDKDTVDVNAIQEKTAEIKVGPPPKPNRKEYPFVGTINYGGLTIHVENKRGDVREGTGPGGKKWRTKMLHHYGEILGTKGVDKDKLDVYVGPVSPKDCNEVYVIHQNHPGNHPKAGMYDEDKTMLGFASPEEAKAAYQAHYDRKDFFRSMTIVPFTKFKNMIMGEVKGEKVAHMDKVAMDQHLEDLFLGGKPYVKRERMWKNKATGDSTYHVGSGLGTSFDNLEKTAEKRSGVMYGDGIAELLLKNPEKVLKKTSADELKVAEIKHADKGKISEILKRVDPEGNIGRVAAVLSAREPNIDRELLNELGRGNLQEGLATPAMMGMMLKPQEFQRILLSHIGSSDLADKLDRANITFPETEEEEAPCGCFDLGQFNPEIAKKLMPMMGDRSYLRPVVVRRIIRVSITDPTENLAKESSNPLLTKIAAAYNWYRGEVIKAACVANEVLVQNPELNAVVHGVQDEDIMSEKLGMQTPTAVALGSVPLTLLYSAHQRRKAMRGEPIGDIDRVIANHPLLSSMTVATGLKKGLPALKNL